MSRRLRTLGRIVDVKRQQCRSLEWTLARLESEEHQLHEEERAIVAALNAEQPLHGLFMETMARHLRNAAGKIDAVRAAGREQRQRLQTQKAQLRHAERALAEAERQERRTAENEELREITEMTAARGAASLP